MISATIEAICKGCSLFFLYAHLCASLSRFRIGLPVCDNVFKELKSYDRTATGQPCLNSLLRSVVFRYKNQVFSNPKFVILIIASFYKPG